MRTRKLGYSDLHLTTVGLGTWAMGGEWKYGWGSQDDAASIAAVHRALDLGINWIDTAPVYGLGHSEEVVGRALAEWGNDVIVATKCSRFVNTTTNTMYSNLKPESIRREVEESLHRLKVEVIDLYQIHWPFPDEQIEEGWGTIADLIHEGKVRYGGVSNFEVEHLKRVQPIHPVASLQPPYSMLRRDVEDELLAYCVTNDIGVIPYSPMQAGLLTGRFSKERVENLASGDWRRGSEYFQEPQLSVNLEFVDKLRPIAKRNGVTLAQLSVAWVLRRLEVTSAIVGARRPSQIEETAQAADLELSAEDIAEIEALLAERNRALA